MAADPAASLRLPGRMRLNWHQTRELADVDHFMIASIGAYGSGKSQVTPLRMHRQSRAAGDVEQRHGLFANTTQQLNEGILPDIFEWLEKLGYEFIMGSKPPYQWTRMWDQLKIKYPQRGPRSPHTLILKSGLHYVCAGLANKAYRRLKGFRLGTGSIEEATELEDAEPIRFILPRIRCGDFGSGRCEALHLHQLFIRGNPPDPRQPHWIRQWIREKCQEERENLARGEPPFFMYLRSSTWDNVENVGIEYVNRLRQGFDKESAQAFVEGSLEQVSSSTTYDSWSKDNVFPVDYDPAGPIHVSMDFNVFPAGATLAKDMRPEEVPARFRGSDLSYTGVFGEFAGRRNMTAVQHAKALLSGDRDAGGHWPANFRGLLAHRGPVFMYGDSTGHMRRVESEDLRSAWQQVNDLMSALGHQYHFDVPRSNPTQYDSVTVLNSKMRSDAGDVSYFVSPWCTELIADYEQTVPKQDGSEWIDKKRDLMRTHWQDPERYRVWRRYPGNRKDNLRNIRRAVLASPSIVTLTNLGELPPVLGRNR